MFITIKWKNEIRSYLTAFVLYDICTFAFACFDSRYESVEE